MRDLGLTPGQFGALTPYELGLMAEGHTMRSELTTFRCAWLAATVLQPHAKEGTTLTPWTFLDPTSFKYIKPKTPEYPATELDRLLS